MHACAMRLCVPMVKVGGLAVAFPGSSMRSPITWSGLKSEMVACAFPLQLHV